MRVLKPPSLSVLGIHVILLDVTSMKPTSCQVDHGQCWNCSITIFVCESFVLIVKGPTQFT